MIHKTQLTHII